MITALFIYESRGDILILKLYKDGVKRSISDVFRIQVINSSTKNSATGGKDVRLPVLTLGLTSFIYIKSGLLWICAVTRSNQDCSLVLEFLYKLESILKVLLLGNTNGTLTSDYVLNNFTMIYELLDEVIEFGYPTNLDLSYLKGFMTINESVFKVSNNLLKNTRSSNISQNTQKRKEEETAKSLSTNITWRSTGIKYRRNEIFLNVEENIHVLMNNHGEVLRSYVDGAIVMKTHLSGMPECRFGLSDDSILLNQEPKRPLNDEKTRLGNNFENEWMSTAGSGIGGGRVILEDSKFHQCVELNKFDSERVIQFIPPDGDFQLMSYHSVLNINLPFKVYAQVQEVGRLRILYKLRIKSLFPPKIPATNVVIKIPTPKGSIQLYVTSSSGKSKFVAEDNMIVWKFNKFYGEQEYLLTADVDLNFEADDFTLIFNWSRPPIKVDFTLDMFSSLGLTVKFLKVQEKLGYRTVKWVKYSSKSGSFDVRY